uniref:hypothetical protein n=1 Tax=Escherichia coli TaxID=562 RepID=UPI0012FF6883
GFMDEDKVLFKEIARDDTLTRDVDFSGKAKESFYVVINEEKIGDLKRFYSSRNPLIRIGGKNGYLPIEDKAADSIKRDIKFVADVYESIKINTRNQHCNRN